MTTLRRLVQARSLPTGEAGASIALRASVSSMSNKCTGKSAAGQRANLRSVIGADSVGVASHTHTIPLLGGTSILSICDIDEAKQAKNTACTPTLSGKAALTSVWPTTGFVFTERCAAAGLLRWFSAVVWS